MMMTMRKRRQQPSLRSSFVKRFDDPWRRAAIAYWVYGLVYIVGAMAFLTPERQGDRYGIPFWVWYVAGAALWLGLPPLIWRGARRLTQVLTVFVGIKALWLMYKQGIALGAGESPLLYNWFFAATAMVTSVLLYRASWTRRPSEE